MKRKIFALHPAQKELIEKICFEKCKEICIGCINDPLLGAMFPCGEENCEYEEKRIMLGELEDGRIVYLRVLKEDGNK